MRGWLRRIRVKTLYIEPGSPWENGYCESFNSKLSDELLECEQFSTLYDPSRAGGGTTMRSGPTPHLALWFGQLRCPAFDRQCRTFRGATPR